MHGEVCQSGLALGVGIYSLVCSRVYTHQNDATSCKVPHPHAPFHPGQSPWTRSSVSCLLYAETYGGKLRSHVFNIFQPILCFAVFYWLRFVARQVATLMSLQCPVDISSMCCLATRGLWHSEDREDTLCPWEELLVDGIYWWEWTEQWREVQIAHLKALTLHIGRASQEEAKHQICSETLWVCVACVIMVVSTELLSGIVKYMVLNFSQITS